ncbi:LuxR C-terminal-related transcriptional regulator [Actinomadura mexicana]|uniref:DNA-binding response regulator, NarL/FixJ family, contains REC and HTH domains n=1 Tax=Actinomadura mexicana TaxID=134959 RepID=A0A238VPN6_9ACTN|nr:response regulator transcription factor [Actinomadura mexicana]SNR36131.1 DNA-binding response regulator, NarL/FixJ family, contains REC and HTH domains [Actinomadura mexicana]
MRVLVVDDQLITRVGLHRLLTEEGHQVVGMLDHPDKVAPAVSEQRPDAVVLDLVMPPDFSDEGVRIALGLRRDHPLMGILVLSEHAIPECAERLLTSGEKGTGYLLKERIMVPHQLSRALLHLVAGGTVMEPELIGDLMKARNRDRRLTGLSGTEREVLELLAEGLTDKGIAERLYVSKNTVSTHVSHIFDKLDLPRSSLDNRRVLAILTYLQRADAG